ncbi:MAG: DUF4214 domain-containing protein, partial [Candidatus Hodarchaeales archaeon]
MKDISNATWKFQPFIIFVILCSLLFLPERAFAAGYIFSSEDSVQTPPETAMSIPALINYYSSNSYNLEITYNTDGEHGTVAAFTNGEILNIVIWYYDSVLDRAPEPGEAEYWAAEIERIVSLGIDVKEGFRALGKTFFNSEEYLTFGKSDQEYVIDLYETFLGRTPLQEEVDFWSGLIEAGLTRD